MKEFTKYDHILTFLVLSLSGWGLLNMFSITHIESMGIFQKHLLFLLIGIGIYLLISQIDYNYFAFPKVTFLIWFITTILLILTIYIGEEVNGVRRWIRFSVFQFQTAEFAKICSIITISSILSNIFSKYSFKKKSILGFLKDNIRQNLKLLLLSFLVLVQVVLIFLEPSAGNAVLTLSISFLTALFMFPNQKNILLLILIIFLVSNISFQILNLDFLYPIISASKFNIYGYDPLITGISFILILCTLYFFRPNKWIVVSSILIGILLPLASTALWNSDILETYQKNRITSFLEATNPKFANKDSLYQTNESKSAISSGFLFGKGLLRGNTYVPFKYNDFVYSHVAEENGFLGSTLLLGLFLLLVLRVIIISQRAENLFAKGLALGTAGFILLQAASHIFINLGSIVNTGIPLPFFSYGGSSTIALFILLGLTNAVSKRGKKEYMS